MTPLRADTQPDDRLSAPVPPGFTPNPTEIRDFRRIDSLAATASRWFLADSPVASHRRLLLLVLLPALVWFPSLTSDFVLDDIGTFLEDPLAQGPLNLPAIFGSAVHVERSTLPYYRPIITLTYWLDRTLWGTNPAGFHLTNLLWHVATVLLAYVLLRQAGAGTGIGLAAATLFAVLPSHAEAVAWIQGRVDLVFSAFFLAAASAAVRLSVQPTLWARAVAILAFVMALLAKEPAVILPGVLVLNWRLRGHEPWRATAIRLAPFLMVLVSYFFLRHTVLSQTTGFSLAFDQFPARVLGFLAVLLEYLRIVIWPGLLPNFHMTVSPSSLVTPTRVMAGLGVGLGLLLATVIVRKTGQSRRKSWVSTSPSYSRISGTPSPVPSPIEGEGHNSSSPLPRVPPGCGEGQDESASSLRPVLRPRGPGETGAVPTHDATSRSIGARVGVGWFVITLLPVLGVVAARNAPAAGYLVTERYVYLPSLGLCIVVAWGLARLSVKPRWALGVATFLLVVASTGALVRAQAWRDPETMYRAILPRTGDRALAHVNLGTLYLARGEIQKAIAEFEAVLREDPTHAMALNNLGVARSRQGRAKEALALYRQALQQRPSYAEAWNNIGVLMEDQGKWEEARTAYQKAVAIDPSLPQARKNLKGLGEAAPPSTSPSPTPRGYPGEGRDEG